MWQIVGDNVYLLVGAVIAILSTASNINVGTVRIYAPRSLFVAILALTVGTGLMVYSAISRPATTVVVQAADLPPSFEFKAVPNTVPMCNRFLGAGNIPEGKSVLLFDRRAGSTTAPYYYGGVAEPEEKLWSFPQVTIGEPDQAGLHVILYAVVVTDEFAAYIETIDSGSDEPWFTTVLPGPVADDREVERNNINTPCTGG